MSPPKDKGIGKRTLITFWSIIAKLVQLPYSGNRRRMKQLNKILVIGINVPGYCKTTDPDTIDHWQIYNGTRLIFGGNDSLLGTEFQGVIKKADLKELVVQYNHCARYSDDFEVTLEIRDEEGKRLLTKKFKGNSGIRMAIKKDELRALTARSIIIRYREKRENGTDKILGRITFV